MYELESRLKRQIFILSDLIFFFFFKWTLNWKCWHQTAWCHVSRKLSVDGVFFFFLHLMPMSIFNILRGIKKIIPRREIEHISGRPGVRQEKKVHSWSHKKKKDYDLVEPWSVGSDQSVESHTFPLISINTKHRSADDFPCFQIRWLTFSPLKDSSTNPTVDSMDYGCSLLRTKSK